MVAYTLLVAYRSQRGRELERVVVAHARVDEQLPRVDVDARAFCQRVATAEAAPTAGLWERSFGWVDADTVRHAQQEAETAFEHTTEGLVAEHAREIQAEQADLDRWLGQRALDVCGEPTPQQALFGRADTTPGWQRPHAPAERLAAFAIDKTQPSASRREAEGALQLYRARAQDLARQRQLERTPAEPLGLVMLLPREKA